jgi:hypothetical protein
VRPETRKQCLQNWADYDHPAAAAYWLKHKTPAFWDHKLAVAHQRSHELLLKLERAQQEDPGMNIGNGQFYAGYEYACDGRLVCIERLEKMDDENPPPIDW